MHLSGIGISPMRQNLVIADVFFKDSEHYLDATGLYVELECQR